MRYRRADVPGATYFFTVNLADRSRTLLVDHVDILRTAIRAVKKRHPFHIDAMVVLPEHLHAIWTLPAGDRDFSTRWLLIKAAFSRRLPLRELRNNSRLAKAERGIWQRRFWEHLIRDERDYATHVAYIHYNPVRHGHAQQAAQWPYSSIHRFIAAGIVAPDWGHGQMFDADGWGE